MELESFKKHIQILSEPEANKYRTLYINKYIDTRSKCYTERVEKQYLFSDGLCYTGYLWDFLKTPSIIQESHLDNYRRFLRDILVFWDNHSKDRIRINNYWKFGKKSMINLDYNLFLDNMKFFPEDIYLTDRELAWTIVFTHEEDIENNRIIMQVGLNNL